MEIGNIDSYYHGLFVATGGLYDAVAGTPVRSTSVLYGSDPASMRSTSSDGTGVNLGMSSIPVSTSRMYCGARVRVDDAPATARGLMALLETGGSATFFYIRCQNDTLFPQIGSGASGSPVSITLGQWYWLEIIADLSATTWALEWRIDEVAQTGITEGSHIVTNVGRSYTGFGGGAVETVDAYFSCAVNGTPSNNSDWLGARTIRAFKPNGVGTHNLDAATSVFFFKDDGTETALTTSETTSWEMLDDDPMTSTSDRVEVHSTLATGSAGPTYTGTGANNNDGGTTAWTNPTNIQGDTTSTAATCNISSNGGTSQQLRCTNFGFSLPAGAVIDGVTVEVEQQAGNTNRHRWNNVRLLKAGTETGNNLSDASAIPTSKGFKTFGGSSNLWGATLSESDVEATGFGVSFKIDRNSSQATTTSLFRCRITINYHTGSDPSATLYAEYTFVDSAVGSDPVAVRGIVATRSDTGTVPAIGASAKLAQGGSETTDFIAVSPTTTLGGYTTRADIEKPSGGAWTESALNATTMRLGTGGSEVANIPRYESILLEALYVPSAAPILPPPPSIHQFAVRRSYNY